MLALLYFFIFLTLGIGIANRILAKETTLIRIWAGLTISFLGLMWCPVPFSFFLGFSKTAHLCSLILMTAIYLVVYKFSKNKGKLKLCFNKDHLPYYLVFALIFITTTYLFYTHVLIPKADGLYAGQSTFGDLNLHAGIVQGLAQQKVFPPEYTIFPGQALSYPFLTNLLSASLNLLGLNLRWSILLPSIFMSLSFIMGFMLLSQEVLKSKLGAVVATVLFFFNGGLGIIYFLGGSLNNFTRIFTAYYETPTNLIGNNIRWTNVICDMIIPQRTILAGWTILIFILWLLIKAIQDNNRKFFIFAGLLASLLPMVHTHTFLALGIVCFAWFFAYFFSANNKLEYFVNWVLFAIPVLIIAFPQLFYWTFPQSSSGHFLKFKFDWANDGDSWPWFWIKNVGLVFLAIPFALAFGKKPTLKFYSGALLIFIIADTILFQPNPYDNNKLFLVWYMFTTIITANLVVVLKEKINPKHLRVILLTAFIFLTTISAVLSIGREAVSSYMLYNSNEVAAADYIKENINPKAMILTANNHNNFVSTLTGRNILCGTPSYLYFHGVNYEARYADVEKIYKDPVGSLDLLRKYKVNYVLIASYERGSLSINEAAFARSFPLVYSKNDILIYAVKALKK